MIVFSLSAISLLLKKPHLPSATPFLWRNRWWWALLIGCLTGIVAVAPLPWVLLSIAVPWGLLLLRSPWLIWPLFALMLPWSSAIPLGAASMTEPLLLLAIGLWLMDGVRRRSLRLSLSFPAAIFLLHASFQMALLPFAFDLGEAFPEVLKWCEVLLIIVLLREMVPDDRRRWVVYALLLAGVSQALWGVIQFLWQIGPSHFVILDRFMRASGTFAQPNPYAGYLGTLLPVGVSMTLATMTQLWPKGKSVTTSSKATIFHFCFYLGATVIISLGILVSWSRGGWLGMVAGLGVVLILRSRLALVMSLVTTILLVLAMLVGSLNADLIPSAVQLRLGSVSNYLGVNIDDVLNQPVNDDNFSVVERMAHWKAAILMWEENLWVGVGPGGYPAAYPRIIQQDARLALWEEPLGHAHNIYLNTLAETGSIGFIVYLTLFGSLMIWVGLQSRGSALALGILGVLVYLAVHNFFDNLYVQGIYLHLGLWLALIDQRV